MAGISATVLHEATGGRMAIYYALGRLMDDGLSYADAVAHGRREWRMRLTEEQENHLRRLLCESGTQQLSLF